MVVRFGVMVGSVATTAGLIGLLQSWVGFAPLDELAYVRRLALRLEREGHRVADVTVQHPSTRDAVVELAADVPGALVAISKPDAEPLIGTMEAGTAVQVLRGSTVRSSSPGHRATSS